MTQSTFSIRMDEGLKRDFNQFCDNIGMSMSTAFVVFAKTAVRERRFPFEIGEGREVDASRNRALRAFEALRADAEGRDEPEMSLDEINAEISVSRAERRARTRS